MRAIVLLVVLALLCAVVGGPTAATPEVTCNREIVPLLQQHCQECHRAGGGAPFVLERYEHVYQRRDKILESVEKRHMPPWKAVSGYGDLLGERRLSDAEIANVARWVAGGAPEGAPGDRPAPRKFANAAGIAAHRGDGPYRATLTRRPRSRAEALAIHASGTVPAEDPRRRAQTRDRGRVGRRPTHADHRHSSPHASARTRDESVGKGERRLRHAPDLHRRLGFQLAGVP